MRTVLNIVWLVLAGFWLAIGYVLAGIVSAVFIITIPSRSSRSSSPATPSGRSGEWWCTGPIATWRCRSWAT